MSSPLSEGGSLIHLSKSRLEMKRNKLLVACGVPSPHQAFRRFQYGKVGRAWYLFSREHDVIRKWQKFAKQTGCVSHIFNRLYTQRLVWKTVVSHSLDTCGKLVPWLFSLFWAQSTHAQLNPFYHHVYPDITHVRKDTRPSPALPYWNCDRG